MKKPTVLMVEDDLAVQRILTSLFEIEGFEVVTAGSQEEILEKVQEQGLSGLLLDLSLPGIKSENLIFEILDMKADLPIFVMTGAVHPEEILGEAQKHVRRIFIKPFDPAELIEALRQMDYKPYLSIR